MDRERLDDGRLVVAVSGELDSDSAPRLIEALDVLVAEDGVVVDLSGCPRIDSTGLGVLVGTGKRLNASGRRMALVCSDRNLQRLLEMTCLSVVFEILPTRPGSVADGCG